MYTKTKGLLLLVLIFLSINYSVFAQREFIVNGVLFENGTKVRLALAEIRNMR